MNAFSLSFYKLCHMLYKTFKNKARYSLHMKGLTDWPKQCEEADWYEKILSNKANLRYKEPDWW